MFCNCLNLRPFQQPYISLRGFCVISPILLNLHNLLKNYHQRLEYNYIGLPYSMTLSTRSSGHLRVFMPSSVRVPYGFHITLCHCGG